MLFIQVTGCFITDQSMSVTEIMASVTADQTVSLVEVHTGITAIRQCHSQSVTMTPGVRDKTANAHL